MRPLHVLSARRARHPLVGVLFFLGRGETAPDRSDARRGRPSGAGPRRPPIETAALDGPAADGSARAATVATPQPSPRARRRPRRRRTRPSRSRAVSSEPRQADRGRDRLRRRPERARDLPARRDRPRADSWIRRVEATTDADGRFRIQPDAGSMITLAVRALASPRSTATSRSRRPSAISASSRWTRA